MKMRDSVIFADTLAELEKAKVRAKKRTGQFARKCYPIYEQLKWKWFWCGIPSESQIKQEIDRLIDELGPGIATIETGGLRAVWYTEEDDTVTIEFEFVAVRDFA